MNSWRWNELEEDALADLPHEAQILYLRIIRKHMDYATGITGEKRRISYAQIQEALSYKPSPHSGEKPVEYSRDQIKRLVQKLVKAGLIERLHITEKGVTPMIFRLPLACCDSEGGASRENPRGIGLREVNSEQKENSAEPRHMPATVTAPQENPHGRAFDEDNRATCPPHKNDEPRHPSGSPVNPITSPNGDEPTADAAGEQIPEPDPEPDPEPVTRLPSCPHQEILDLWAEIMPDRRQPIRSMWMGSQRATDLAHRWKQGFTILNENNSRAGEPLYHDRESGIEWWGRFFRFLRKSEFLMKDDSRWFGMDWIVKASNFEKILSRKYHGGDQ